MSFPGRKYQRQKKNRAPEDPAGSGQYRTGTAGDVQPVRGHGAALGGDLPGIPRADQKNRPLAGAARPGTAAEGFQKAQGLTESQNHNFAQRLKMQRKKYPINQRNDGFQKSFSTQSTGITEKKHKNLAVYLCALCAPCVKLLILWKIFKDSFATSQLRVNQ
jgi:hypothetical protein